MLWKHSASNRATLTPMTLRSYQVLFWIVLGAIIIVFSWYAYLYSRGLVTFTLGPNVQTNATTDDSANQVLEPNVIIDTSTD
jgi:hypothetical protein